MPLHISQDKNGRLHKDTLMRHVRCGLLIFFISFFLSSVQSSLGCSWTAGYEGASRQKFPKNLQVQTGKQADQQMFAVLVVKAPRREKELTWRVYLCCQDKPGLILRYSRYWVLDVLQVLDTGGTPGIGYLRYSRYWVLVESSPGNYLFVVKVGGVAAAADPLWEQGGTLNHRKRVTVEMILTWKSRMRRMEPVMEGLNQWPVPATEKR